MWSRIDEELHMFDQTPEHLNLMERLRKTLYYGGLQLPKCKVLSKPLVELVTHDAFAETHDRIDCETNSVGQIKASPCSLILALIYLDLLKELDPQYVRLMPPSELILVAMMVSTKFHSGYDEDVYITEWAECGNVSVDRLKALEIEFLTAMNWKIFVSNESFFEKLAEIERGLAERESNSRGWLTYTELCTLMPSIDLVRSAVCYSVLLAVSYTAGVIALAGAFLVATQVPGSYLHEHPSSSSTDASLATAMNESVASDPTIDCRTSGSCLTAAQNLSDLEERLILSGVEWTPDGGASDEGQRILAGGTNYRTVLEPRPLIGLESLAADGIIRKREENDSSTGLEWQPFQTDHHHHDLTLLSWLKLV